MPTERPTIERLELSGYTSIRQAGIEFRRLNVLIGANGAGKSNLVSFFALLRAALDGKLDDYVGRHGGPNSLLYLGTKHTTEMAAAVTVQTQAGKGTLYQRYGFRAPDSLFYSGNHAARPEGRDRSDELVIDGLCSVVKKEGEGFPQQLIYVALKDQVAVYHFHDTTLTAPVRQSVYIEDNQQLRADAGNLAAMLYLYQQSRPKVYRRILAAVRQITPFFEDFVLEPQKLNLRNILLNWRARATDYVFGPHQLSDGTLRFIALVTLLSQPREDLPVLLVVDEPELGLHPAALNIVAGLIRSAGLHCQVLVATQSPALVDLFEPQDVLVAERQEGQSVFRRLEPASLEDWLKDYTLGELWEKNIFGGGPFA